MLGPGLAPAIVAFDLWIGAVATLEFLPGGIASRRIDVVFFIGSVAATFAGDANGMERNLLRKAVEETLFVMAGNNIQISPRMARSRWARCIKAHGKPAVIEMFVANYLWNVLWLGAGDVFGQSDNRRIEYRMRRLRRTCLLLVREVCQSMGLKDSVSLPVAEQVVGSLEAMISFS